MEVVKETVEPKVRFTEINQIGIIVRDIRAAMRHYWETVGIGPWTVYALGGPRFTELTYQGEPVDYTILMAFANLKNIQIELIQPVEGHGTSYEEFLAKHGEGIQHLGMLTDDLDEAQAEAEANGLRILQSCRDRTPGTKGGSTYLDTQERLGTLFEFIQRRPGGTIPLEPIETYP